MRVGIVYSMVEETCRDATSYNEVLDSVGEIERILKKHKHEVVHCNLDISGLDAVEQQLKELKKQVDIVFNLAESLGEDTSVEWKLASLMTKAGLVYTGASSECLKKTTNKDLMKEYLTKAKISTPQYQIINSIDEKLEISFPVMVKPSRENGSVGIFEDSVAEDEKQLKKCVKRILNEYKQPALVEEYIEGREFQIGILNGTPLKFMFSELKYDFPEGTRNILTYDGKWTEESANYNKSNVIEAKNVDPKLEKKLFSLAEKTYNLFNRPDYCRIDFRVRKNKAYVLELNANPGINPQSVCVIEPLERIHLSYEKFIMYVFDLAVERLREKEFLQTENLKFKHQGLQHIKHMVKWFNDESLSKYMDSPEAVYSETDLIEGFTEATKDKCFIFSHDKKRVGYCSIYDIDYKARKAEVSVLIGEKEFHGKGFGKEATAFMIRYAFEYLKLNSLFATITELNVPSIKTFEKCGFKRIGVRRDYEFINGKFEDEILFDMTKKDYDEILNAKK